MQICSIKIKRAVTEGFLAAQAVCESVSFDDINVIFTGELGGNL